MLFDEDSSGLQTQLCAGFNYNCAVHSCRLRLPCRLHDLFFLLHIFC